MSSLPSSSQLQDLLSSQKFYCITFSPEFLSHICLRKAFVRERTCGSLYHVITSGKLTCHMLEKGKPGFYGSCLKPEQTHVMSLCRLILSWLRPPHVMPPAFFGLNCNTLLLLLLLFALICFWVCWVSRVFSFYRLLQCFWSQLNGDCSTESFLKSFLKYDA